MAAFSKALSCHPSSPLATVTPPDFLACEGGAFSPRWNDWRRRLQRDGADDKAVSVQACALLHEEGQLPASEVGRRMAAIYRLISRPDVDRARNLDEAAGLCYLGLLAAAFVCHRAHEAAAAMKAWWPLLGAQESLEFLADGGWAVRPIEVFDFRWSAEGGHASGPLPRPLARDAYVWRPPPPELRGLRPGSDGGAGGHGRQALTPLTRRPPLLIAVIGHHTTFALSAAMAVASGWEGPGFLLAFFTCIYAQRGIDELDNNRVVRGPSAEASAAFLAELDLERLASARAALGRAFAAEDWNAPFRDVLPGVMVWLVAELFVIGRTLREVLPAGAPMLHLFDSNFWLHAPPGEQPASLTFLRAAQSSPTDAVVPLCAAAAAQLRYVAGLGAPAVWPGAYHVNWRWKRGQPAVGGLRRLFRLAPSHAWLHDNGGGTLMAMLQVLLDHFEPREARPVFAVHEDIEDMLGEFVRVDGALFFPEDVAKVVFHELYAAAVPLFVPALGGLLPRQLQMLGDVANFFCGTGLELLRANGTLLPPGVRAARRGFTVEPFDLSAARQGHLKAWYWSHLADFATAPHVARFESLSGLILMAAGNDLDAMSEGMTIFSELQLHITALFFAGALDALLLHQLAP